MLLKVCYRIQMVGVDKNFLLYINCETLKLEPELGIGGV
jgi:hypothetical protein